LEWAHCMVSFVMDEDHLLNSALLALDSRCPKEAVVIKGELLRLGEDLKITHERLDQTSRELAKLSGELKGSEKKRNEMLSICAHDLKSPTSSILSFLDILRSPKHRLPALEVEKVYDRMDRAGRHMWNLVNDLLDTSQIESGTVKLDRQAVLMSQLVREVVDHTQAKADAKEIQLNIEVLPAELKVSLDPQKGLQIINNLVSNALKFTPRGGRIDFKIKTKDHKTTLEVIDSGQGIPPGELQQIFEKFKQTSTRSTEGEKGSGLGLSIVQQLVTLHSGEVSVRSNVGQGTTFELAFPIAESTILLKLFSGKNK
jgi:signal transduction histidine kinase